MFSFKKYFIKDLMIRTQEFAFNLEMWLRKNSFKVIMFVGKEETFSKIILSEKNCNSNLASRVSVTFNR